MKILTKEQEQEHYNATLQGGILGTAAGLGVGLAGVGLGSRRYRFMRELTLPLKAFLVTSAGTFAGIVSADHYSRAFEAQRNPKQRQYDERRARDREAEVASKTFTQRAMEFGKKERYKIVVGSWVASMFAAFAIVNRNKYLTGQQKLVQARVYAQFLTLGVLVASAAFEISDSRNDEGRWETIRYIDPNDPEHKRMIEKRVEKDVGSVGAEKEDPENRDLWKSMVKEEEEERLKEVEKEREDYRKQYQKQHNGRAKKDDKQHSKKKDQGDVTESGSQKDEDSHEKKEDAKGKK